MYGETRSRGPRVSRRPGLSPHVRGNLSALDAAALAMRSIPACTGKPIRQCNTLTAERVYPRMYGETRASTRHQSGMAGLSPHVRETVALDARARPWTGLSPHVRGNRRLFNGLFNGLWSIPACTGKPETSSHRPPITWVYPRMYGETSLAEKSR